MLCPAGNLSLEARENLRSFALLVLSSGVTASQRDLAANQTGCIPAPLCRAVQQLVDYGKLLPAHAAHNFDPLAGSLALPPERPAEDLSPGYFAQRSEEGHREL